MSRPATTVRATSTSNSIRTMSSGISPAESAEVSNSFSTGMGINWGDVLETVGGVLSGSPASTNSEETEESTIDPVEYENTSTNTGSTGGGGTQTTQETTQQNQNPNFFQRAWTWAKNNAITAGILGSLAAAGIIWGVKSLFSGKKRRTKRIK